MSLPDEVNIDCQYQQQAMGPLVCKVAEWYTSRDSTNQVDDEICHKCEIGKIYRELGCEYISGQVTILQTGTLGAEDLKILGNVKPWCVLRKRKTTYEYCLKCPYIGTQFTKPVIEKTIDFYEKLGFSSAKHGLEKARDRLFQGDSENAITNSITAIESVFKSILDRMEIPYPEKETITSLWKTIRTNLHLGDEISSECLTQLIGNLSGAISSMGSLRNDLSDAHGKGLITPEIYSSYAELAVNIAAVISLFVIRRFQELNNK